MSNDTKQIVFNRMDGDTGIEVGLHKSSIQMRVYFEMKLMKDDGTKISKITSTDSDLNVGTNEEGFIRIHDSRNSWDANSGKYKRTAVAKNKKFYVQAGAGIVSDSVPEREYQECLDKMGALIKAIEYAEENY